MSTPLAFVTTHSFVAWAGSEELWFQTALRFAQDGYPVSVNIPSFDPEAAQISQLEKNPNVAIHRRKRRWPLWRRLAGKVAPVKNPSVDGWLEAVRPALVVISQGGTVDGLPWMQACHARRIPYVILVHLSTDSLWPDAEMVEKTRSLYATAAALFFVSENNCRITEKHFGMRLEHAKIVRNPYLVRYDNETPWPDSSTGFRLACVGRLGAEHKGQDLLFEVMRQEKWKCRPIRINLVGQGHHRETLERLKVMWNVSNIDFGGQTSNIEEVWRHHHALIMPSRYEGLPLALVEAMLSHRPAIVTNVGGNSELVEEGRTGFIASAPTVEAFDDVLERAWESRDQWQEMGIKAGQDIRQKVPRDPVAVFAAEIAALLK